MFKELCTKELGWASDRNKDEITPLRYIRLFKTKTNVTNIPPISIV